MTHLTTAKRETSQTLRPFMIEPATVSARPGTPSFAGFVLLVSQQAQGQSQDHLDSHLNNLIPALIVFPLPRRSAPPAPST